MMKIIYPRDGKALGSMTLTGPPDLGRGPLLEPDLAPAPPLGPDLEEAPPAAGPFPPLEDGRLDGAEPFALFGLLNLRSVVRSGRGAGAKVCSIVRTVLADLSLTLRSFSFWA